MDKQFKTSESQRRASKKYLSKFKDVKVRFLPEEHEAVVAHAKTMGDRSTVSFIMRAIHEAMERDKKKMQKKKKE